MLRMIIRSIVEAARGRDNVENSGGLSIGRPLD
jgi:hypothetical protein